MSEQFPTSLQVEGPGEGDDECGDCCKNVVELWKNMAGDGDAMVWVNWNHLEVEIGDAGNNGDISCDICHWNPTNSV